MPFDVFSGPDAVTLRGPLTQVADPSTSLNMVMLQALGLTNTSGAQAISTGNTITLPANISVIRLTAAAACTGVIIPAGPANQAQFLCFLITTAAANTITFAAAGTSNVAGGAAVSLAGLAAHLFVWDPVGSLWYQCGPLAN